jgi:hypothetical protein
MLIQDIGPDDISRQLLSKCQNDAEAGKYARALAGFVHWLAPRYEAVQRSLRREVDRLRQAAAAGAPHRRTPGIVADLAVGLECFLHYAVDAGVFTQAEARAEWADGWKALQHAAARQARHQSDSEPTRRFLELVSAAIASGEAHLADLNGQAPDEPNAWGWRERQTGTGEYVTSVLTPQGRRIGWMDEGDVYLEAEAAFAAVQRLARDAGDPLAIGSKTLNKRLHEKGLLARIDPTRRTHTVRKTAEGKLQTVLHLKISTLIGAAESDIKCTVDGGESYPVPPMSVFWNLTFEESDKNGGPKLAGNAAEPCLDCGGTNGEGQKCQICQIPRTHEIHASVGRRVHAPGDEFGEEDRDPLA